ncbi:uncharacterized protein F54H12.2-like [Gigantopelta aegis]|uniref:uncharacterized protein F54H12.2-like n=1 Tax=Gigantopelta aegis TaxID=1735272 RepID=UPI001B88B306|nr:uncharacterized protein F54H12.2-like [Gigantopelta aegis]
MSLLNDKDFEELVPASLNLFTLPPYQTSIYQHYFVDVRPLSQINNSSPLEFQVSNSGSDYIDLKRSRLHVTLKVKHADDTVLDADEHIAPVNLFLQSLFSQVSVYLQSQLVSSTNNHYAYKSIMKTLLNYGLEAKSTQLSSQLFYKDMAEVNDDMESTDPITGSNSGLGTRASFIQKSKVLTMSGPLYEDIFNMNRHLINGVDLTLKLYRSAPKFCLMSGASGKEYTIELLDAYLKVCKLKVNPALILAHNTLFQNSNALYPYTKSEVKVTSIPTTQQTHTIDNVSNPIASRYIVGFVESDSLNGKYTGNPFNFQSSMLKTISLYVDGVSVPGRPTQADDIDSYVNIFDGMDLWGKDKGNNISRSEFLLGSGLFVFEIDMVCAESEYLNLVKSGSVRLEIEFKSALTKTLSCVILSERNSIIEIDKTRNVFIK